LIPVPPPPVELPPNVVAVVTHVRGGTVRVAKPEFHHALAQAAAARGRGPLPKPGSPKYERLKRIAIGERLDMAWIQGQGAEMGIHVTGSQVARELRRLKTQAFKSGAGYQRFLKEGHFTRRDIRERIELLIISRGIQERVVRGADSEAEREKAFSDFIDAYGTRWRARTTCAPEYLVAQCSNAPAGFQVSSR
jgi:hypothetical protein